MARLFGFADLARTRLRDDEVPPAREAVRRVLAQEPVAQAAAWLASEGWTGTLGGEWNSMTLGRWLSNPAIAGLAKDPKTGQLEPTGGPAVITPEEFVQLQDRPSRPGGVRSDQERVPDHDYACPSGLGECGECQHYLTGIRSGAGTPSYRCNHKGCMKVLVQAALLEDYVGEHVLAELWRPSSRAELEAASVRLKAEAASTRIRIEELKASREDLAVPYATGDLSRTAMVAADKEIKRQIKDARTRLRFLEQIGDLPIGSVEDLAAWWEHAPAKSKGGLMILLLEKITVNPARSNGVRTIEPGRVVLHWRSAATATAESAS